MPKDIRSFFNKVPGSPTKPKEETKGKDSAPKDDGKVAVKSSKQHTAQQEPAGATKKRASPRKAPSSRPARGGSARGKRKHVNGLDNDDDDDDDDFKEPVSKRKAAGSRKVVVSDDSDDDFVVDITGDDDEDKDDSEMSLVEDEEEEGPKASKKRKTASGRPAPVKAAPAPKAQPAKARPHPSSASPPASATPKPRAKSTNAKADKPQPASDVQAAIEAVDKAVELLPEESGISFSVYEQQEGAGWNQRGNDAPAQNPGSKDVPRAHPDCLTGKTFVITGNLESLGRDEATELVKKHSGRVTGSVSGKTTFLLVGQDAGRKKVDMAREKGVKLIDESGLFSLFKAAPEPKAPAQPAASSAPAAVPSSRPPAQAASQKGKAAAAGPSYTQAGPSKAKASDAGGQLWVQKHKPQTMADLIGNPSLIATIKDWLVYWDRIHLKGEKVEVKPKGGGKPKDLSKKALMLSGPPGIGKTSSAMIVARELGFMPVEVNASDTRNKADKSAKTGMGGKLSNAIKELANNTALNMAQDGRRKRMVLIMDEVDGMSAGDRGGVADLIQTLKGAKLPIICICNDKYNQKLKSLRNHCLELDYRRPTSQQMAKRLLGICQAEGLQVNEATLACLVEGSNGDIRAILGQLQMIRLRRSVLAYDDAKGKMSLSKDADMSPFEAGRKLLALDSSKLTLNDRIDLVFQDADLVPLLVQENYINHKPVIAKDEAMHMKVLAKAADALSAGDLVNRKVRQYGSWGLMPFAAAIGSVYPATYMRGNRETYHPMESNWPRFPAWLGQNSSQGKQRRLLGELHTRMSSSGHLSADRLGLRTSYLPTLRYVLTRPLATLDKEGIPEVIETMSEYCLSRDDLDFVLSVTKFKGKEAWKEDPMASVETQTKAAFTRTFNKAEHKARCNLAVDDFKKKKGKGKSAAEAPDDALEAPDLGLEGVEKPQASEEELDEEEDLPDEQLAAKTGRQLARKGITFEAKQARKGKKGGQGSGGSRGGRGSAAAGRGARGGKSKK
ncbi:hypothetical protein CVIRNUC_005412 [Coccomyxa viridis]|uniref:Replication factor C subunit 1 n=1 Tax=Coccomyxa viridis TaxID=1274662 RepID=A0AAV1I493_9CHLO|nr:hypothetical protein CVIRNUC_005412 [Coccomyxa viridis]